MRRMRRLWKRSSEWLRAWWFERKVGYAFRYPPSVAPRAQPTLTRYRRRVRRENPHWPETLIERIARRAATADLENLANAIRKSG